MKRLRESMTLLRRSSCSRLWPLLSLYLLVPAQTSGEHRWTTTRQLDGVNDRDIIFTLPDTPTKTDTNPTDTGWAFHLLISTDKGLFKPWNKQLDTNTKATLWTLDKDNTKRVKSSHTQLADHLNRIYTAGRTSDFSKRKINEFSGLPKRRTVQSTRVSQTLRKNIKRPNWITRNKKYDRKDRVRRSSGATFSSTLRDSIDSLNGDENQQGGRQTDGQERPRQSLKRRTERRTAWTEHNPNVDPSTAAVEVEPAHENFKEDLVAEESLSAPIFVTIVQRNEESDYFTDRYPPYPPLPKYHHEPQYYPPPFPLKYHNKPEYHPQPPPPYLPPPPPPPPIYHPAPQYHPPPPPPPPNYHPDDGYHHLEVKAKYYHASDYNEPSYHKPKFYHESLYHHELDYPPPVPPPLPLPKHKREHSSHPPVYDPKIHHEPKHHHSYLPLPPSPPKNLHKPDYYPEPAYHHHEVQYHHSAPTNYEYNLDIYDRKDTFEPQYRDHPKRSIDHQVLQPQPYINRKELIEEVKQEYRKGSRSFEQGISHLTAVHVNGDNLYEDAPPNGFIKAKYEPSATSRPEPYYPPLPPPTSSYQRYNEAPLPLPPQPPASHYDIKLDNSPKTRHVLPLHPNPLPFHDVPLPAPLPSLEDVDPLIFEPIFSYNDYFDATTKIPVGDEFSLSVSSLLLPRDSPFHFNLNKENIHSSQLPVPKIIKAFTNPPSSSILPTYKSPTFTAEEEEEEYFQDGLTYTPLTSAKPPLLPTTDSALPVTYNTSAVLASPNSAPEVPVTSSPLPSVIESPLVSKEIVKSKKVTSEIHVFQEQEIQESPNDTMINLSVSEAAESLTATTRPTKTTPGLKLTLPPTDLSVTSRDITALLQTDDQIMSDSLIAGDSSEMTEDTILFTDALTDTLAELVENTSTMLLDDPKLHQSTERTPIPMAITTPPQTDNSVLTESLATDNSFEIRDDIVSLTGALSDTPIGSDTTTEPSTIPGFSAEHKPTRPILKQRHQKTIITNTINETSSSNSNQLTATRSGHSSKDFFKLFYPNLNPTLSVSLISPNAISHNDRNKLAQFFLSDKKVSDSNGSTVFIKEKEENFKSLNNNSPPEKTHKSRNQDKRQPIVKESSSSEQNLTISHFYKEIPSYPIAEDGFQPILIPSKLTATNKTNQTPTPNKYNLKYQSHTLPINMYSTKPSPYILPSSIYGSKSSSSISSMYKSNPIGFRSPASIFEPSKPSKWLVTTRQDRILSLQRNSKTRFSSQATGRNNWNLPVYFQL